MLSFLKIARKAQGILAVGLCAVVLAACEPVALGGGAVDTSAAVPVALLVPSGSGQASDELLARSLENAARLAISDLGAVRIDLRVYSTSGQPGQAQAMAIKAADEGARIILGPVFAQEANAAGVAMANRGINVLSFSNNTDIAGGNVFVLGPTFQNSANRLASYAARQGKRRILVVHDKNTAGEIGAAAIQRGVAQSGGSVVETVGYEFSQNGIVQAVPAISAAVRTNSADALFLTADTAGALPLVTQLLKENSVDPAVIQFIGLTR
ncbi:MAG: penicillin-binding protein activator, partial [Paracoccaceae bacterium]|nr:penicillin-binding protein activator [Paracoccaceae bacterium]